MGGQELPFIMDILTLVLEKFIFKLACLAGSAKTGKEKTVNRAQLRIELGNAPAYHNRYNGDADFLAW